MKATGPPRVGIRAVREAYGLSVADLQQRIEEHGVKVVNTCTIRNVETGHTKPGLRLLHAWARALKLNPVDVIMPDECCCHEQDADAA